MSLRKNIIRQRDFGAGEIDPSALRRDDTKIFKAALRLTTGERPAGRGGPSAISTAVCMTS